MTFNLGTTTGAVSETIFSSLDDQALHAMASSGPPIKGAGRGSCTTPPGQVADVLDYGESMSTDDNDTISDLSRGHRPGPSSPTTALGLEHTAHGKKRPHADDDDNLYNDDDGDSATNRKNKTKTKTKRVVDFIPGIHDRSHQNHDHDALRMLPRFSASPGTPPLPLEKLFRAERALLCRGIDEEVKKRAEIQRRIGELTEEMNKLEQDSFLSQSIIDHYLARFDLLAEDEPVVIP